MARIEEALARLAAAEMAAVQLGSHSTHRSLLRPASAASGPRRGADPASGPGAASSKGRRLASVLTSGSRSGRLTDSAIRYRPDDDSAANWLVGRRFEHLVREALLAHPAEWGRDRFAEVWLWKDWPEAWGPDEGIDLVARQTEAWGGGLVAIQCKYRGQAGRIATDEIDSFLASSADPGRFSSRLLVTNAASIQRTGEQKLQRAKCELLHTREMDDWVPDWTKFVEQRLFPGDIEFERHEPRPYQQEALDAIEQGLSRAAPVSQAGSGLPGGSSLGAGRTASGAGFNAASRGRGAAGPAEHVVGDSRRGKLILPCGTGKSFIALRAAERVAGGGRSVLYLVPSIALMGQTMREWSRQRDRSLRHVYLAVCSDTTVGRRDTAGGSGLAGDLGELAMPVTTDAESVAEALARPVPPDTMRVVFSTYHSTPIVAAALARMQGGDLAAGSASVADSSDDPTASDDFRFDLIVADEAHRTTGLSEAVATAAEKRRLAKARYQGVSPFNLVHHDEHLPADRRLYMTATPRVFTAKQRRDLEEGIRYDDADSYSMDDPEVYGEELYRMSFADAIDGGWLSDYQVLVIARATGDYESAAGSSGIDIDGTALDTKSAVKLGGCWDALATPQSEGTLRARRTGEVRDEWGAPARSAIAFCGTVRTSKKVAAAWERVAQWHRSRNDSGEFLHMDVEHLDASTPAVERASLIGCLRRAAADDAAATSGQPPGAALAGGRTEGSAGGTRGAEAAADGNEAGRSAGRTCRVLTNVRVLSEGVDVPALDAVVFLESRSSPIDVTQAVGRVMRRAEGKDQGYIVIPVVVDEFGEGTPAERARRLLRNGNFKPVWDVVRALRAHDERIDYWLNAKRTDRVKLLSDRIRDDRTEGEEDVDPQLDVPFEFGDGFASMLLDHCGDRQLYPSWGKRAAVICGQVGQRVRRLASEHPAISEAFSRFHRSLQKLIGEQKVTRDAAAEMVAQHVVTIPVFDHVVARGFAEKNPLARALGTLVDVFAEHGHTFVEELRPLDRAYRTMERAFRSASTGAERLNVLKEIYESFFKEAMPSAVKSLGIVYTPVEIVDFMLRSVDALCRDQFGRGLTDRGVHVLDPFTGTGTFLSRLLTARGAGGEYLVRTDDIDRKYGTASAGTAGAGNGGPVRMPGAGEGSGGRGAGRVGAVRTPGVEAAAVVAAEPTGRGQDVAGESGRHASPGEMHAALRLQGELHANEIVLLAYYIAALKVEEARHERLAEAAEASSGAAPGGLELEPGATAGPSPGPGPADAAPVADGSAATRGRAYQPFGGIVLTDTFLMSEKQAEMQFHWKGLDEAGERVQRQKKQRIRVIVGNPPWSAGRKAAGDESVEPDYTGVAGRVSETYVRKLRVLARKQGKRPSTKAAGNLFVKAFRWASDRLYGDDGIVAFVHPNSLADAPSLAGMRKALRDEFTDIHVVNLRGNAYKSGAEWELEGDKVFGQGSRNGVQITFLVRNRQAAGSGAPSRLDAPARLRYAEVPERSTLEQKFAWLAGLGDVLSRDGFRSIPVNDMHDWVNLGDPTWNRLMPVCGSSLGPADAGSVCREDALGVATALDAYAYSFSRLDLGTRMTALIDEFNAALGRWREAGRPRKGTAEFEAITSNESLHAIKWTDRLRTTLARDEALDFDPRRIREVLYRPFTKLWLYEDYRILSAGRTVSAMFPRSLAVGTEDQGSESSPIRFGGGAEATSRPRSAAFRPGSSASGSSPRGSSSTSAPPADRPGRFPEAGHPDHGAVEPHRAGRLGDGRSGGPERAGSVGPAGATLTGAGDPETDSPEAPVPGDSPESPEIRGGGAKRQRGALLVASPSNKAVFGVLAAAGVPDLCGAGTQQACRALPRWRS